MRKHFSPITPASVSQPQDRDELAEDMGSLALADLRRGVALGFRLMRSTPAFFPGRVVLAVDLMLLAMACVSFSYRQAAEGAEDVGPIKSPAGREAA